jgi:hypothetical protein
MVIALTISCLASTGCGAPSDSVPEIDASCDDLFGTFFACPPDSVGDWIGGTNCNAYTQTLFQQCADLCPTSAAGACISGEQPPPNIVGSYRTLLANKNEAWYPVEIVEQDGLDATIQVSDIKSRGFIRFDGTTTSIYWAWGYTLPNEPAPCDGLFNVATGTIMQCGGAQLTVKTINISQSCHRKGTIGSWRGDVLDVDMFCDTN